MVANLLKKFFSAELVIICPGVRGSWHPPPRCAPIFWGLAGARGARGTQEELGGARGSQKEPGEARARGSQEEPGGARGSQEEPGGARRSQESGGARSQEEPGGARKPGKPEPL